MFERLLIVILLAVFGLAAYQVTQRRHLRKVSDLRHDPILAGLSHEIPTIVYFTTPNCIPCKTQQQPALKRLGEIMPVQVVQIDASENPEAAERWGVMTAPTTFILDTHWQPKAINYGLADETKLYQQVNAAMQVAYSI
jgi:thiol-disulfide isomerase/thioredoxin